MTEILSKNLFDLLDPDESQVAEPARLVEKKEVKKPAVGKVEAPRAARGPRNEYRPRGGAASQGESSNNAYLVSPSTNRLPFTAGRAVSSRGPRDTGNFEQPPREGASERGAPRSSRGGRGGRGGRGREFDRRSGTGRYDGEKKEVAGKGTWGDEVAAQTESKDETTESPEADAEKAVEPKEPAEPEEVQLTLEQYMAEQAAKKAVQEKAVRKPNEGADDAQWKDAVVLKKEEDEELFVVAPKGNKGKKVAVPVKEKTAKATVAIEQRFATEPGSTRGGSTRGRGRGEYRGARGGDRPNTGRGPRPSAQTVNVGDQTAFPTLGSK
ncbi:hypothetical protein BDK51DRAFT_29396 [Blyttiomyces helicus]|uniref:Hyaluronan/mRNA-binding protein domain-containing protein n=1 Tax=Blyttiomyces helicus TaxID=388810 RepID=A0A4V1IS90_9FUNG|nr:hypothetical protein BDK51DRAFT_29396 [Blyttiomyces helicus]|eukprot:RKO92727.1 hypothetical protein BDK51DRAFT_29396 [Blyttiomyces helicus]